MATADLIYINEKASQHGGNSNQATETENAEVDLPAPCTGIQKVVFNLISSNKCIYFIICLINKIRLIEMIKLFCVYR